MAVFRCVKNTCTLYYAYVFFFFTRGAFRPVSAVLHAVPPPECIKSGQGCRRSRRISSVSVRRATLDMFRRHGVTFIFVVHIFSPGKNFFCFYIFFFFLFTHPFFISPPAHHFFIPTRFRLGRRTRFPLSQGLRETF